jgi:hypothetical protein
MPTIDPKLLLRAQEFQNLAPKIDLPTVWLSAAAQHVPARLAKIDGLNHGQRGAEAEGAAVGSSDTKDDR